MRSTMPRQPNGPATTPMPLTDDEPPEGWDEVAPPDDVPESDTPATPTNPLIDPDMPGGVPLVPGDSDVPIRPEPGDDIPETPEEEALEDLIEEEQEPVPPT